jgi:copper chaperone CopZ
MREFYVPSMKCSDCVRRITDTARTRDREAIVHADTARGYLAIDSPIPAETFEDLISDLGYRVARI